MYCMLCVCVAPPSPALNGSSPPPSPPADAATLPDERSDSRADSRTESRGDSRAAAPEPPAATEAPTPPAKREDKTLTAAVTNNNLDKEPTDKKVEELYDIPVGEYGALVILARLPTGQLECVVRQLFFELCTIYGALVLLEVNLQALQNWLMD